METLLLKVIKTEAQYNQYCRQLEELVTLAGKSEHQQDMIELLTVLIEKWDEEHNSFVDADPIELIRFLMKENQLKSVDLAKLLGSSTSLVSDLLNYRRGLSKDIIRKLSDRFKVSQELFNKPYTILAAPKAVKKEKPAEITTTRKSTRTLARK